MNWTSSKWFAEWLRLARLLLSVSACVLGASASTFYISKTGNNANPAFSNGSD